MRTVRAKGAPDVAALLIELAEQIQSTAPAIDATIEFPEEGDPAATFLEVKLLHPETYKWNLVELQAALSHPGG